MRQIHVSSPELTDDAVEQALELTLEETWDARSQDETVYVEKQFELYRSVSPTSTLPKYFVKAWFPYSADTLFNVLHDFKYRKGWDSSVKQAYVVDHRPSPDADDVHVVYWCIKMPWPFTNRDYVFYRRTLLLKDTFVVLSQAGLHRDAPEFNSTQRVEVFHSHLVIRAAGVSSCELFISYSDESNYAVPNTLINWGLATGLPSYLNDLRGACTSYADYIRGLDDDGLQSIPSQLVRSRIDRRNVLSRGTSTGFSLRGKSSSGGIFGNPHSSHPTPLRLNHQPHLQHLRPAFHRSKSASDALPAPTDADLVVEFKAINTGLVLEPHLHKAVVGVSTDKHSEAAKAKLLPGLILVSIDGVSIQDLSFPDVLSRFVSAPRPVAVGFKRPPPASSIRPPSIAASPQSSGQTKAAAPSFVVVHHADALHDAVGPQNSATQIGAVLVASRFNLDVGTAIISIDKVSVVDMAFPDIVQRLRRTTEVKTVGFLPPVAMSAGTPLSGKTKLRVALSTKLSWPFKGDRSAPSTPTSAAQVPPSPTTLPLPIDDDQALDDVLPDYSNVVVTQDNVEWVWAHVQMLVSDERLFSAADLYDKLVGFLDTAPRVKATVATVLDKIEREIAAQATRLQQVKARRDQGNAALHEFNADEAAGWQFGQTYFGISTHWKPGDDGTVWLKLDGICEGVDVFHAMAVIRETDLFYLWAPFCNKSTLLAGLSRVEILTYVNIAIPLMQRDAVIHAFGINAVYEHRCVLLLGQSALQDDHPTSRFPPIKGWNADRMHIRAFRALIEPYGRNRNRTCIVVNVDPKCAVPTSLLNFAIKKMAGILLYLLMREAQKIEKHSADHGVVDDERDVHFNPYVHRIRRDPFYTWLKPRMDKWFAHLEAGTTPPLHLHGRAMARLNQMQRL
ncbi:hypothetical protein DYB32_008627 [Aphanomyces invadans]|uniref:Phosphatidylcholine transfer protein n=1 Tax=Aphanomyces invadans TaxID=157072 RepID=A0A3R6VRR3_9STRA|nr:hypothetical protein DYB32_008627 [Aphanomyces invadans]